MKLKIILPMLALCLFVSPAMAQSKMSLMVDGVQKYFRPNEKPIKTIEVKGDGQSSYMVRTVVKEYVGRDENGSWIKEETTGLVASPKTFVLKGNESRKIRLLANKIDDKEHVYEVGFKLETAADRFREDGADEGVRLGAKFLTAQGMLVTRSPVNMNQQISFTRNSEGITFENKGNVQIDLRIQKEYCYEERCISLPGIRVYPGQTKFFEVDPTLPIEWRYNSYNIYPYKVLEIPAIN